MCQLIAQAGQAWPLEKWGWMEKGTTAVQPAGCSTSSEVACALPVPRSYNDWGTQLAASPSTQK